jgi:hypothetical protein
VLPLVKGLLGLDGDALAKTVTFAPQVPADWDSLVVSGYRVGDAEFGFRYRRAGNTITVACQARGAAGYRAQIELALPSGCAWFRAKVGNEAVDYRIKEYSSTIGVVVELENPSGAVMTVEFAPRVELLPPAVATMTGDANKGLKIVSTRYSRHQLDVTVEGLSGQRYGLGVRNGDLIKSVSGCRLENDELVIDIPHTKQGEFVRTTLSVTEKEEQ